jgi:hypothetical protein
LSIRPAETNPELPDMSQGRPSTCRRSASEQTAHRAGRAGSPMKAHKGVEPEERASMEGRAGTEDLLFWLYPTSLHEQLAEVGANPRASKQEQEEQVRSRKSRLPLSTCHLLFWLRLSAASAIPCHLTSSASQSTLIASICTRFDNAAVTLEIGQKTYPCIDMGEWMCMSIQPA